MAALSQEPGRADDDERVGVVEGARDGSAQGRARAGAADRKSRLDGAAPECGRALAERGGDIGGREPTEAGQCTQRGRLHAGVGILQPAPGQGCVAAVAGEGDAAPALLGAAVDGRIRGNIVPHLSSMSDPDATADGEAAATPLSSDARPTAAGAWMPPLPPGPARRRGRIWPYLLASLALVVIAAFIAARVSVDYYVITPGDATPVSQYIEVPPTDNHPLIGKILLTDVFVTQLNALNYLQYKYFDSNSEVVSAADLLGPTPDEDQFLAQGYLQMAQAQSFATAAALTHLGYFVHSTNEGALVYAIQPGSPAAKVLQVAQVITGVDATPTPTACALVGALHGLTPGTSVSLRVEDSSINDVGDFVDGPIVHKSVTLGTPPKGLMDTGCGAPTRPTAYLGIQPQTQQDWHFPVKVTVHTQDIGGPSAGLAMTLGIIDKLSSGRLTGNRVVAATGTIDQYGNVGDVGGVAEKTIAVERAGATVFFVPSVERATAESKADSQLHVYAVSNLNQVLRILKRLGGGVPTGAASPVPAQAAP
jgi:Lon-like protease